MPDASVGLRHDASAARATSGGTVLLRWAPLAAWIAACLCVALPILGHAFVPMVDLPAHMARQFVMSDSQGALDRFTMNTASPSCRMPRSTCCES
ncbi:hypothetical protein [Albidovulum sp.]|uniref:hypothetical protein n=1 Tax=Albidovulum sp. TaxID=1872424 RepID=UPI0035285D66